MSPRVYRKRDTERAPGDFYVDHDCCTSCGLPEVIAPELIGRGGGENWHCIWKRQPSTPEEVQKAIEILNSQELDCHRYAGSDPAILDYADPLVCDVFNPPKDQFERERPATNVRPILSVGRASVFGRILAKIFRK